MATQNIPLYIPTYIGSINYDPTRVLPRIFFYNGQVDCQPYWIQGFQFGTTNIAYPTQFTNFPYFDNYNVVSGSFPTTNSRSLLYNNENASYGEIPTKNLYTTYWSTYVSLLYNPKTRLLNASAIIPLADYFNMELNDVVNFRGNYYHLRAINDYSVKTGDCNLQLLGPIIPDTFYIAPPPPPPAPQASSSVSWSYTENSQDGTFTIFDNSTTLATLTANGSGNAQISESHYITASLVPVGYPGAGVTMSINVNGGTTLAVSASTNTTISASFLVGAGQQYGITGSITYNAPPNYVSGASLIYDFGYVNSYPGTGTIVYDVSGNGITGSLINSPTYSSVKSGSLSFNKASSQRIEYSGSFPQAYTVQAFFEFSGSNNLYPGIGGQKNNNGMVLAIDSTYPPSGGTYQVYYYGASGNFGSGAKNNAAAGTNINNNFILYSATNDGTNTVQYYINSGSVSTQSLGLDRTLFTPTNQVAYIGYDPDGTQYINGKLVAWLVYPFVLSGAQITQNFNIFNAR